MSEVIGLKTYIKCRQMILREVLCSCCSKPLKVIDGPEPETQFWCEDTQTPCPENLSEPKFCSKKCAVAGANTQGGAR